jgi:uncharacterized protein
MLFRSRFAHFYQRDDHVAIFHSLTSQLVFGNQALLDTFLTIPSVGHEKYRKKTSVMSADEMRIFQQKGFLVENSSKDEELLQKMRLKGKTRHGQRLHLMYLIPTTNCNLDCSYCFVERNRHSPEMSEAKARKAVQYFFHHSRNAKERKIIFYGGEPLLNPKAVLAAADEMIDLAHKDKSRGKITLNLITNGQLVTPELADQLAARKISVSVSMDGPRHIHDACRKTTAGKASHSKAMQAIKILRKAGHDPSISCTVTDRSLKHWDEIVEFIITKLQVRGLGFNLIIPGPPERPSMSYENGIRATESILDAFKSFRKEGIYEDRVMRRVKPFSKKSFHYKDCLGVGGQIAVTPDGDVGPCQGLIGQKEYFPLNIERDFFLPIYKNPLFLKWTDRFPLNFDECLGCPALSICGGGCPIASLREKGSIWEIDERICSQAKPIHEWLVWDLFINTNRKRNSATH